MTQDIVVKHVTNGEAGHYQVGSEQLKIMKKKQNNTCAQMNFRYYDVDLLFWKSKKALSESLDDE